jgi:hypothetical protein
MPSTHVRKRDAEFQLIAWVDHAFYLATGHFPPWTANHSSPSSYAQMMQEVLDLVREPGAQRADAVGLMNKRTKLRNKKDPDWRKKLLITPVSTNKS